MQKKFIKSLLLITSITLAVLASGCDSQGPAEKAGEKIDQSIKSTKDALEEASDKITGKGPAEKAGEKIDEALEPKQ